MKQLHHEVHLRLLADYGVYSLGHGVGDDILALPDPVAALLPHPLSLGPVQVEGLLDDAVTVGNSQTVDGHHALVLQPLLGEGPLGVVVVLHLEHPGLHHALQPHDEPGTSHDREHGLYVQVQLPLGVEEETEQSSVVKLPPPPPSAAPPASSQSP
jgi:hypothetical protein